MPSKPSKEFMQAGMLHKRGLDGGSNQPQKKPDHGAGKKYGNYTDPTGKHHTHWKEGKSYGGSNSGGASIGGGSSAAGGGG